MFSFKEKKRQIKPCPEKLEVFLWWEVLHSHNQATETYARALVINGWNALMAYLILAAKATKGTQLVPIMEVMSLSQTTCPPGIRQTQLIPQSSRGAAGRW